MPDKGGGGPRLAEGPATYLRNLRVQPVICRSTHSECRLLTWPATGIIGHSRTFSTIKNGPRRSQLCDHQVAFLRLAIPRRSRHSAEGTGFPSSWLIA